MKQNLDNNYSIYINGKLYNVSYLCFLCHCHKKFNGLSNWDVYIQYNKQTSFKYVAEQINYLMLLDSFMNTDKKIFRTRIENSIYGPSFKKDIILLGLIYREFKSFWLGSKKNLKLDSVLIFSRVINYSIIGKSIAYNSLGSLLKFYKLLALKTKENILTEIDIAEVLQIVNPAISLNDILNDFKNHLIVVPYKEHYIWASNSLYEWLINEDRVVINALILNKEWA